MLKIVPNDPNTFYARAWVQAQRGEDAAAIEDLGRVLAMAPNDQEALLDRGGLNIRAGRYDDAVADFGRLLKLDPKAAAAAYNRGRAHYATGAFKEAAADFALALKLRADNPYAALRLYLAQSHLGQADSDVLKKGIDKLDPTIWPRPLLELFAGTGTDPALIAGINELPPKLRTAVLCEAQYYLGERALAEGRQRCGAQVFHRRRSHRRQRDDRAHRRESGAGKGEVRVSRRINVFIRHPGFEPGSIHQPLVRRRSGPRNKSGVTVGRPPEAASIVLSAASSPTPAHCPRSA